MDHDYILPGKPIPFDTETKKRLGKILTHLVGSLEDQHSRLTHNLDVWQQLYNGTPKFPRRTDPFPNASNVVVPLIRIHSDNLSSTIFNQTFATQDLWIESRSNEDLGDLPTHLVEFLNRAGDDNEFEMARPLLGAFREQVPMGSAVASVQWGRKVQHVIDPTSLRGKGKPRVVEVETHNGPIVQWIPRKQIMWQPNRSLQHSELVVRQAVMTYAEISRQVRAGVWDGDAAQRIKGQTFFHTLHSRSGRMGNPLFKDAPDGPEDFRPYDMREIWVELHTLAGFGFDSDAKLLAEKLLTPGLMIHMHRDTGEVMSVRAKPYAMPGWPFYDFHFRGEGSMGHEMGVAQMLEHMQAAVTTLLNQGIDAVTIANSILGITNQRELLDARLSPNRFIYAPQMTEENVRILNVPKLIQPDVLLMNLVLGIAERVTGATDPALGREIRQGGHPSPATSTLTLLNQAQQTLKPSLKLVRLQLSRMGEDIASLYQQFEADDNGVMERLLGRADGSKVKQILFPSDRPVHGSVGFDVRALTEDLNPEAARSRAAFVDQATANCFSRLLQAADLLDRAKAEGRTLMASIVVKFMEATTESYRQILESSKVDELEKFILEIKNNGAGNSLGALQQQLQSGLAEVSGPGPGPSIPAGIGGITAEQGGPVAA